MDEQDDFLPDDGFYASQDTEVTPSAERRSRRRKQAVVGVAGLAAVLGGGAFFVTEVMSGPDAVAPETGAMAPIVPSTSKAAHPRVKASAQPSTPSKDGVPVSRGPSPTPSRSLTAEERIAAARAAAAKAGFPLQRPLTQTGSVAGDSAVTVTNSGSLAAGGTMRVVSARYDLSGQRELAWAADDGEPVGSARCTQKFHFSNDEKPKERPTMLLCWRTSEGKSVVTVAVSRTGRPAKAASVAVIDKQWATLH